MITHEPTPMEDGNAAVNPIPDSLIADFPGSGVGASLAAWPARDRARLGNANRL